MDRLGSLAAEALAKSMHVAYMTSDIEQARKVFAERLGLDSFDTFEATLELPGTDGPLVTQLTISFTTTDSRVFELIQPAPGAHPMFSDPIAGASGDVTIFHHVGTRISDPQAVKAFLESAGESRLPVVRFALPHIGADAVFVDMRSTVGHWLEVFCVRRHS
jgi:hypothetical protein